MIAQIAAPARSLGRAQTTLVRGALGVLALVTVFEIVSRLGIVDAQFLPPFSIVLTEAVRLGADPAFQADILATFLAWLLGLSIATAVAVPIGVALGSSELSYRLTRAVIELIRPMPAVALIPLVILIAGQGLGMTLVIAVFAAVWPILFNTISGIHGVDPKAREMARSFGLGRASVVRRVVFPSAAPFIATGIRISSSIVLIVIISVELFVGAADGIGSFIAAQRALGTQVVLVYAGTLWTGVFGLVVNLLLSTLERHFFGWSYTTRGS